MPDITIPRSDGSETRWPEGYLLKAVPIHQNPNYYEKVGAGHPKHTLFMEKIGNHLATVLGYPNPNDYKLREFPSGYSLFVQHKMQPNSSERTDIYLHGSKYVLKFRSPAEFFQHAEWLWDTSKSLDDHSTCTCKYSPSPATSAPGGQAGASKRKSGSGPTSGAKKAKQSVDEQVIQYKKESKAAMQERAQDVNGRNWFRKGELVWCDLKPIRRPPSDTTSSTTEILAWPGIVTGVRVDPVAIKDGEPSENYSVLHGFKYDVKLCGQLEPNEGSASEKYHHLGQVDLLPFNAIPYEELLIKATKDVQAIAKGHRAQFGKEAAEEVEQIANWRKTFGNKMPIGDTQLPERWEKVLVHYAHALKISDDISHSWCQTDGYGDQDTIPVDTNGFKRTYYQGLWWGTEKIWKDEMVRLKKLRNSLPVGPLLAPSPGAEARGVFLRINTIYVDETPNDEGDVRYSCLVVGDLFELTDEEWMRENDPQALHKSRTQEDGKVKAGSSAGPVEWDTLTSGDSAQVLPKAPQGYVFRQLNSDVEEVSSDVFDVAGRLYTQLSVAPWLKRLSGVDVRARSESMMGLAPGTWVTSLNQQKPDWKDSRYATVIAAHATSIAWLDKLFKGLLTDGNAAQGNENGHVNGEFPLADGVDSHSETVEKL